MRVAIPARSACLDAEVDSRFGRASILLVVDTETNEIVGIHHHSVDLRGEAAGIRMAEWVIGQRVDAVLTGEIGRHAKGVLRAGDVVCMAGVEGTVRDALGKFKRGIQGTRGGRQPQATRSPSAARDNVK